MIPFTLTPYWNHIAFGTHLGDPARSNIRSIHTGISRQYMHVRVQPSTAAHVCSRSCRRNASISILRSFRLTRRGGGGKGVTYGVLCPEARGREKKRSEEKSSQEAKEGKKLV